ncbi:outer membrane beta-barrel protein [Mesonia sp. JHPTF-M18]|uniref:Outer membrane beta-barrel protein n=1 Tax=Mesonia aestuariivivens TaxID=2796128 RepID=A0ABS6W048_9FLAO|nr:outer membrane beta-barrel protein [Mesonia aestuariivivens]
MDVFGRYYFFNDNKFNLFGELGLGYGHTKDINDNKFNGINVGLAPGVNYFVSEHFALEATFGILGYTSAKPDIEGVDNESTDSFQFSLNMSDINLGLIYRF